MKSGISPQQKLGSLRNLKETTRECCQWQKLGDFQPYVWLELFCYFLWLMTFPVVSFFKVCLVRTCVTRCLKRCKRLEIILIIPDWEIVQKRSKIGQMHILPFTSSFWVVSQPRIIRFTSLPPQSSKISYEMIEKQKVYKQSPSSWCPITFCQSQDTGMQHFFLPW